MQRKAHTVYVCFPNHSKQYSYLTDDDSVRRGDYVVVMSPSTGPTAVKVMEVLYNTRSTAAVKWVVDKIDFAAHEKLLALQRSSDLKRREQEITQLLDKRKKQIEHELVNSRLRVDPEYQRLIYELRGVASASRLCTVDSDFSADTDKYQDL